MTDNKATAKAFYRSWKFYLALLLLVLLSVTVAWNIFVTTTVRKVLADYSQMRVNPITFEEVSCNPFTEELTITGLVIPQVKLKGVKDELLQGTPVFACDRLVVSVDRKKSQETKVLCVKKLKVEGMVLGAVIGPEITRVALSVFPGFLMGEIPDPEGLKLTKFDYRMAEMELKGKLICDPSRAMLAQGAKAVVLDNVVIKAKNMHNLPEEKLEQEGVLSFACGVHGGSIKAELTSHSMAYFDQKGNGFGVLEVRDIPLKEMDLFVQQMVRGMRFEKGGLHLNWRIGIQNGVLKPEKTIFVVDKIFARADKSASHQLLQQVMFLNFKGMYKKDLLLRGRLDNFFIEDFNVRLAGK